MSPPGKSHGPLLPLSRAQELLRAAVVPLGVEQVALAEAQERILAAPIAAARDLPGSDISMMDGYALRACDGPGPLRVAFEVAAGDAPSPRGLEAGEAARIFTGAPLPPGADCVAMQEQCAREGDRVVLQKAAQAGQHVRRRGEEMRAGAVVLAPGCALGAVELSLAAGAGATQVAVHARPRVALLATGDELLPLGATPRPGQLVETNSLALAQACRDAGAVPLLLGIASDDPRDIAARLRAADADLFVTTGGASVGDHDHASDALAILGGAPLFHGLAIRPGKPALCGLANAWDANDRARAAAGTVARDRRLVFCLPGNPAASLLCFELLVRPALRWLQGASSWERPRARARLVQGSLARVPGLTFFPRGRAVFREGQLEFTPSGQQSSMQIGSWAAANAVAVLEPGESASPSRIEAGELLEVLLLRLD